jgi:UPF0716 protein FxsA
VGLFLLLAFVVLPLVELYVIVQVAHVMGVLPTIGLLLVVSFAGAWVVKREGLRAWAAFRAATSEGRVPARETADGALVILGGALLLAPGFVTDFFGALCVLPPTRALVRRLVTAAFVRRVPVVGGVAGRTARRVQRVRSERMPDRKPANQPRDP